MRETNFDLFLNVSLMFCLQGDLKAFDSSGHSWSPAGPHPHFTLQRNGKSRSFSNLLSVILLYYV